MSDVPQTLSASSGHLVRSDAPQHAGLVYREVLPIGEQLDRLGSLHLRDKSAEKRVSMLGWAAVACVVIGIASVFISAFAEIMAISFGAVLLPLAIPVLIVRWIISRNDIDDRKLHSARRVLDVLQGDLKPGSTVAVKIDFGSYEKTKPVNKTGGVFSSVKQYQFIKADWLDLRFTLFDGTRLKVTATTQAKRKTKAKRKYTKVKDQLSERLVIVLTAPKGGSLSPQTADAIRARLSGGKLKLAMCKIKPKAAMFGFSVGPAQRSRGRGGWSSMFMDRLIDGDTTLEAVLKTYKATAAQQQAA